MKKIGMAGQLTFGVMLLTAPMPGRAANVADLRLVAESGERSWEQFTVVENRVMVSDGGASQPVPDAVVWKLRGDPSAGGELFWFTPDYDVIKSVANESAEPDPVLRHALIRLRGELAWNRSALRGAIVVFVWLADGQVTQVVPVAAQAHEAGLIAAVAMPLTEASARGAPAVLLWKGDHFVRPRPWFKDATANRALVDMFLASPNQAEASLRQVRDVNLRPGIPRDSRPPAVFIDAGVQGPTIVTDSDRGVSQWGAPTFSLLDIAAEGGRTAAVQTLLSRGAVVDVDGGRIPGAWHAAVKNGRAAVVELLPDPPGSDGGRQRDELRRLAMAAGHADIAARLMGGDARDSGGIARLALRQGDEAALRYLAVHGAAPILIEQPPALFAYNLRLGRTGVVRAMLEAGWPVDGSLDDIPWLVVAAAAAKAETMGALLERGARPDAPTDGGVTALMASVIAGSTECLDALLAAGADANVADTDGRTALHYAIELGQTALAERLLERGKAGMQSDAMGRSPLDVALAMQSPGLVDMLMRHGAQLDLAQAGSATSLLHAIAIDAVEVLQHAVTAGWKPDTTFHEHWSAAEVAHLHGAGRISAWLTSVAPDDARTGAKLERGDVAAVMSSGEKPADARTADLVHPAVSVKVTGVVTVDGELLFPRISDCADVRLALPVLSATTLWRFRPATLAGRPVASRVSIVVPFPAADRRVHSVGDVAAVPAIVSTSPAQAESVDTDDLLPTAARVLVRLFRPGLGGVEPMNAVVDFGAVRPATSGDFWAALTLVVSPNGQPGEIQVLGSEGSAPLVGWERALLPWKFAPGQVDGRPVRTRVTLLVRSAN